MTNEKSATPSRTNCRPFEEGCGSPLIKEHDDSKYYESLEGSDSGESIPAPFLPQLPFSDFFSNESSIAQLKVQTSLRGRKSSIDKSYRPIPFDFRNFAFKSRQVIKLPDSIKNSLLSKFATGKFSNGKVIL